MDAEGLAKLAIKESLLDGKPEVACFLEDMDDFYQVRYYHY